jgi:hypothetical protein
MGEIAAKVHFCVEVGLLVGRPVTAGNSIIAPRNDALGTLRYSQPRLLTCANLRGKVSKS